MYAYSLTRLMEAEGAVHEDERLMGVYSSYAAAQNAVRQDVRDGCLSDWKPHTLTSWMAWAQNRRQTYEWRYIIEAWDLEAR